MARKTGHCGLGWLDLLHALCVLAALLAPVSAIQAEDEEELEPWEAFEAAMRRFRDGDPDRRREAAAAALESLLDVDMDKDPDARARVQDALWWLWETLHADRDDWHATRFLPDLAAADLPVVGRIYLDALASTSRNVQAGAIARFAWKPDHRARARLEELWEKESRPWVLVDLMEAFIELESTRHAEDFRRLAHAQDGEMALAAIRALAALRVEGADRDLAELVRQASSEAVAVAAVGALTRWPDSEVALDAVLDASRSDRPRVRDAALRTLGAMQEPEALDRLVEAVSRKLDESVCAAILDALVGTTDERVTPALVELLRWAVGAEAARCTKDLLEALYNRDDPAALAGLTDLVTAVEPPSLDTVNGLAAYLSRDRSAPQMGGRSSGFPVGVAGRSTPRTRRHGESCPHRGLAAPGAGTRRAASMGSSTGCASPRRPWPG